MFIKFHLTEAPLYLESYWTTEILADSNGRQANVDLIQKLFQEITFDSKRRDIFHVKTLQNIEKGEKLLEDYGSLYHFRSML